MILELLRKILHQPSWAFTLVVSIPHIVAWSLTCWLVALYELIFHPKDREGRTAGPRALWMKMGWARTSLSVHRISIETRGEYQGDVKDFRGVVFVSNHQSIVDVMAQMHALPANTSFVAKKELRRIPIFGFTAHLIGTLFVDRKKGTNNESLNVIGDHLKRGGNILMYPEGTRSLDGRLLPFKRGALVMAIENQVPIVPLTIMGTKEICPKKSMKIGSGTVRLFVDSPILTKGKTLEDRFSLSEQVRAILAKNLDHSM